MSTDDEITPAELLDDYGFQQPILPFHLPPHPQAPRVHRVDMAGRAFAALRAVLDLHDHDTVSVIGTERRVCIECSDPERGCWTLWPCETVLTITWALEDS